jgi:hypothetical protein
VKDLLGALRTLGHLRIEANQCVAERPLLEHLIASPLEFPSRDEANPVDHHQVANEVAYSACFIECHCTTPSSMAEDR